MSSASSLSNYLDVTSAASAASGQESSSGPDPVAVVPAAKVLAAINELGGGPVPVTDVRAKAGLDEQELYAQLAWLAKAGLVQFDEQDGVPRVQLADTARAALAGA